MDECPPPPPPPTHYSLDLPFALYAVPIRFKDQCVRHSVSFSSIHKKAQKGDADEEEEEEKEGYLVKLEGT